MNILFCASECFPFSKTGGLADMAHFLPKSLKKIGHNMKIISPYYPSVNGYHHLMTKIGESSIYMGGISTIVNYYELIHEDMTYIFVQNMHYFERENLYGYDDDAERFTCFSYAVLDFMKITGNYPDILHLNDWQTGMIPYLLDLHYRNQNDSYMRVKTLFTIHNLEYQGTFDTYVSRFFNTEFNYSYVHFGRVNFLKAGISRATMINTVSPTYQEEVMTKEYGFSLDGSLWQRHEDFYGILNGIDDTIFNPKNDSLLVLNYDQKTVSKGKIAHKKWLYNHFVMDKNFEKPLIVYIGRLAHQKGLFLIEEILEEVIYHSDAHFILMGSGIRETENFFQYLRDKYPNRVATYIGFNEAVAHKIYAASDIFLMPSLFEPCGLGQMIAMKYGSLPIVRETGGLRDTVKPYNEYTGEGTGFSFKNISSYELKETIFRAIDLYKNNPTVWNKLVKQAMNTDFSLEKMAESYDSLYKMIKGA